MIVLGLTGSIGMGKSTAAADFRRLGVPVHDADAVVHGLLGPGGAALAELSKLFPEVVGPQGVDRQALGARVFHESTALKKLEGVLHPLVRIEERRFLRQQACRRAPLVVLDIPLLFETGGETRCDAVAVVSAPPWVQARRVLARPGMTRAKFRAILARQMADREKRRRADYVIPTGLGRRYSLRHIQGIIADLVPRSPGHA
ncbi:dephospho-CoA kinase [Magnetospira thiophila]